MSSTLLLTTPRVWDYAEGKLNARLRYWSHCFTPDVLASLVSKWTALPFVREVTYGGKKCLRRATALGPGDTYSYKGGVRPGSAWPSWLSPIKSALENDL